MILRNHYMQKIKSLLWKHIIKILVGQRRVGKTTLLKQIIDEIGADKCVFLSLDNLSLGLDDTDGLKKYIEEHIDDKTQALLIDEIQLIDGWEKVVNHVYSIYTWLDIIITGSNSAMFSSELATLLSWRYMLIQVFGFSYEEYRSYYNVAIGRESFEAYLMAGTTPSLYQFEDAEIKKQRCESLIDTIIVKDISLKWHIRDIGLLKTLILYILNNNTNLTNISGIVAWLKAQWYTTNIETVGTYIEYLKAVFLFYEVERYDLQWKHILQRQKKFYLNDPAMRALIFGWYDIWLTKTLENIVYLEMRIAGRVLSVGKMWEKEIDFICEKWWKKMYLQVTYSLIGTQVIEREYSSMEQITDNRPKYVVSLDAWPFESRNGIIHLPLRELSRIAGS